MSALIVEIEKYVNSLLSEKLHSNYLYHNLAHTQRVVENVKEISENLEVSVIDVENLEIAAWFHDVGFIESGENHEEKSVKIAVDFLKSHNLSEDRLQTITELILATKMNSVPKTILEKILRDADAAHLSSKDFFNYNSLLRKEWELVLGNRYYTDYALKNWTKDKEKNLSKILKNQKKFKKDNKKFQQKEEALNIKKNKSLVPERGVETMFRVALRNHITLSDIADTKANILLSVNAIIVSLALSSLLPKLDNPSNSHLFIPSIIFIIFTVISIVLSILATRPNVTEGKFTKEDVANKKVNLLFFGNFHQMKLEDFEWGISEMMQDRDYLYGSLTKDLYFLGLVLNRKYKLLRITYTVFMTGIIVSVLAFAFSFYFQEMVV